MSKNQFKQAVTPHGKIAEHLAAILENPATPVALYNAIVDEVTDWSSAHLEQEAHGATYLAKSLECFNRREAALRRRAVMSEMSDAIKKG